MSKLFAEQLCHVITFGVPASWAPTLMQQAWQLMAWHSNARRWGDDDENQIYEILLVRDGFRKSDIHHYRSCIWCYAISCHGIHFQANWHLWLTKRNTCKSQLSIHGIHCQTSFKQNLLIAHETQSPANQFELKIVRNLVLVLLL